MSLKTKAKLTKAKRSQPSSELVPLSADALMEARRYSIEAAIRWPTAITSNFRNPTDIYESDVIGHAEKILAFLLGTSLSGETV